MKTGSLKMVITEGAGVWAIYGTGLGIFFNREWFQSSHLKLNLIIILANVDSINVSLEWKQPYNCKIVEPKLVAPTKIYRGILLQLLHLVNIPVYSPKLDKV